MADLGFMYKNRTGIPQDVNEAIKLYRKSADTATPQGRTPISEGLRRDEKDA
jgi:TPR repeat protein